MIVDFSQFRGKTLILYNDAPAAFPARVPGYDYYTGGPDLSPAGAPTTLPGYGPNTRTIMQVKVSNAPPAVAFDRARHHRRPHGRPRDGVRSPPRRQRQPSRRVRVRSRTRSSSARPPTTRRTTVRTFVGSGWCNSPAALRQRSATGSPGSRSRAQCPGLRHLQVQVRHPRDRCRANPPSRAAIGNPLRAEGHARRDELGQLRRVGAYDRQPRVSKRPAPLHCCRTSSCTLREPSDRDPRLDDGMPSSLDVTPISVGH